MVYQTDAVEAGTVGLDGPCRWTWVQATREALELCPPPCVLPHLCVDQAGAVLHQGKEAAKAESQEMLQVGIFLLTEASRGNVSNLGYLRLLQEVITGSGRAP